MKSNAKLSIFFATIVLVITGCSSMGVGVASYTSEDPTPLVIENEVSVPLPFEQTWDKLVKELVTQFYVINNIDKESRLINLTFSSDHPEQYVTGGISTREFRRGGTEESISYDPAASSSYKKGWKWGQYNNLPSIGTFFRKTSLVGRANIYVAPEGDGTKITVNCRYVLSVDVTGTFVAENAFGTPVQRGTIPSSSSDTASFNSNAPTRVNWGTPEEPAWITFRTTGKFEKDILSMVR